MWSKKCVVDIHLCNIILLSHSQNAHTISYCRHNKEIKIQRSIELKQQGAAAKSTKNFNMIEMPVEGYLFNIGKKRFFGTQAYTPVIANKTCCCLSQVENLFPKTKRLVYTGIAMQAQYNRIDHLNIGKDALLTG